MYNLKKQPSPTTRPKTRLFFTGFTMGVADLVPGVSGGTIAFLFGIYDELLYTIRLITGKVPKLLLAGKFKQAFALIPFGFLVPVALGAALAIFGLVQVVSWLLETQPALVWAFFFGLVLGSVYIISRRVKEWTLKRASLLLLGFVATFIIVGLPSIGGNESPIALIGTGALAITAMILPGISGSLMMVLLGQYEIIINAVADRNLVTLAFFALGAIAGLAVFVRLLTWLIQRFHFAVIALLIGVMAGSLRRIWPWQVTDVNGVSTNVLATMDLSLLWAILLIIAGFAAVFILEKVGIAKEHDDVGTRDFKKATKEIKP
jgi:putative membrane protein